MKKFSPSLFFICLPWEWWLSNTNTCKQAAENESITVNPVICTKLIPMIEWWLFTIGTSRADYCIRQEQMKLVIPPPSPPPAGSSLASDGSGGQERIVPGVLGGRHGGLL